MFAPIRLIALAVALSLLSACSGEVASTKPNRSGANPAARTSGSPGNGRALGLATTPEAHVVKDAKTTWDVELHDHVTLVEGDALGAVRSAQDARSITFDKKAARAANLDLTKGRVLLIAGHSLGRINAVTESSDSITVRTEQASLADAINDGTVAWDVPLAYDFDHFVTDTSATTQRDGKFKPSALNQPDDRPRLTAISMQQPDGSRIPIAKRPGDDGGTDDNVNVKVADIDITVKPQDGAVEWVMEAGGNKYQFRITAQGESAKFLVVVSRGGEDSPTMAFRGEGTVSSLRSSSSTQFANGAVAGTKVGLDNLQAELDLSVSVAGAGTAPASLELPVPMLTFVWMVGPIPVTVDVKADIIGSVQAELNASAQAKSSFAYRGDVGFTAKGTKISTSGNTKIERLDPEPADSAAPMGVSVDAQFGVAFPDVSLSLFGQGFVPSIYFGAVVGSNLWWGEPKAGFAASSICKSAYVRAEVVGKYSFEILGKTLDEGEHVFWEKRRDTDGKTVGCDIKRDSE